MFPSGWVVNTLKEVVLVNDKKLKEEKEKKKRPICQYILG